MITLEEKIQGCKDQAARIVAVTPFATEVHFKIADAPWEDFKRVTGEKDRFAVSGGRMAYIINAPGCQINLITVPLKIVTTYEVIETPKAELI